MRPPKLERGSCIDAPSAIMCCTTQNILRFFAKFAKGCWAVLDNSVLFLSIFKRYKVCDYVYFASPRKHDRSMDGGDLVVSGIAVPLNEAISPITVAAIT